MSVTPDTINRAAVDPTCSTHIPAVLMLAEDWLPLRRRHGEVLVAAADTLSPDQLRCSVGRWYPGECLRFVAATRAEVQSTVLGLRGPEVADHMSNAFTREYPEFAARSGPARWQQVGAIGLALAALAAVVTGWGAAVIATVALLAAGGLLFRTVLASGAVARGALPDAPPLADAELPSYTVLIAAYEEQYVIADTLRSICAGDYPPDRLEVLVLLEHRDTATIRAVREAQLPPCVRVVLIPPGAPQTKPRAANLGLLLARGDLVVIFDADDRPEPDQLRRVANQFAAGGDRLAVVQARLNFYNRRQTLLTRLFSIEYAYQWDLVYTGLSRWGLPLPLGGTSNHARTRVLRAAGGWDAWNVTEDADLGMRMAALGYQLAMSPSVTWEEAAARPWPWIRQRTRWLKGHLMTLAVHTRRPLGTLRRFGVRGTLGLVGIVGGSPFVSMLLPVPLLGLGWLGPEWLGLGWPEREIVLLGREFGLLRPALIVWAAALGIHLLGSARGAARGRRDVGWIGECLLLPYYWLLAGVAGWRAVVGLVRAPFQWDKTTHGSSPEPAAAPPTRDAPAAPAAQAEPGLLA